MAEGIILGEGSGEEPQQPASQPAPPFVTIYLVGPATRPRIDQMASLSKALCDAQPGTIAAWPMEVSSPPERFQAVLNAMAVILIRGWERDVMCRHEAQLAIWCNKTLFLHAGLRKPDGTPVLHGQDAEQIQAILDRGLELELPAEGRPGEPDGEVAS